MATKKKSLSSPKVFTGVSKVPVIPETTSSNAPPYPDSGTKFAGYAKVQSTSGSYVLKKQFQFVKNGLLTQIVPPVFTIRYNNMVNCTAYLTYVHLTYMWTPAVENIFTISDTGGYKITEEIMQGGIIAEGTREFDFSSAPIPFKDFMEIAVSVGPVWPLYFNVILIGFYEQN